MADNVSITPGSGAVIATNNVGGTNYQVVQCAFGPDGGALTWVDATHGMPVAVVGTVPVSGTFWQATQPVSAASLPLPTGAAADASVNGILVSPGAALGSSKGPMVLGSVTTAAPSYTTGQISPLSLDVSGNLRVISTPSGTQTVSGAVAATQSGTWNVATVTAVTAITNALPAGTNTIGNVGIVAGTAVIGHVIVDSGAITANIGTTNGLALDATLTGGTQVTKIAAATTGGATPGQLISAASTNATSVKASAGTLYSLNVANDNASKRYIKFYDKASAPTVGSDTPIQTIEVPGNSSGDIALPACGLAFSSGIALAITGALAVADTTVVSAGDLVVGYSYK